MTWVIWSRTEPNAVTCTSIHCCLYAWLLSERWGGRSLCLFWLRQEKMCQLSFFFLLLELNSSIKTRVRVHFFDYFSARQSPVFTLCMQHCITFLLYNVQLPYFAILVLLISQRLEKTSTLVLSLMSLVWSEYSYQKLVYACFSLWQQNNTVKATGAKQQINMPNLQQTTE